MAKAKRCISVVADRNRDILKYTKRAKSLKYAKCFATRTMSANLAYASRIFFKFPTLF